MLHIFSTRRAEKVLEFERPYILFLSILFCYKNADKVIQAFALAKGRYRIPYKLVIGGTRPRQSSNRVEESYGRT